MYLWTVLIHKLKKEKKLSFWRQARLMPLDVAVGSVNEIDKMKYHNLSSNYAKMLAEMVSS